MAELARPYPLPDRDTAFFWEAQNRHELVFQKCAGCALVRYPVGPLCPGCLSFEFAWVTSGGRGRVHSYTVVRHQTHPAFPPPYTVLLVEMAEGPRVVAQLREDSGDEVRIGERVRIAWEDNPPQSLPVFVRDE